MSHHPHASIDRESSPQVEIDDEWLCEPTEVFIVQRRQGDDDDEDVDLTEPESLPLDDDEPELIKLDTVAARLRALS
jgi:hypothetical protein